MGRGIRGSRILIVEDEYYLADDLADALKRQGAEILGPVGSLDQAREAVQAGDFDAAIVDMNLRGELAFSIADQLKHAGIPFLITTGYNNASLPDRLAAVPRIEKPFDATKIIDALPDLLQSPAKHR